MSTQDSSPQGADTAATSTSPAAEAERAAGENCEQCGADVTWFTLREFAEHIKDNPERRAATKEFLEQSTKAFGPALDLRFKECASCGDATAVSTMRIDPSSGRVVRHP
ncbi:hypothetical protein [Demequina aurantiaca]|uniref:hypothetical protein n=1 Tax=Demequina aurantiaca TaxID=676200 RepID=UPI003D34BC7E